jgi:predicted transcriptional regulator
MSETTKAIKTITEQESWQIKQIEEAIQQANHPDTQWIANKEISAWLNTWGTENEASAPNL